MRFTQIRHAGGTTELKWQGHHNSDSLETRLSSDDQPHAGFSRALEALRTQVPKLIGAPKEYADGLEVRSLGISYLKGDRRGFVISATKPVEMANGPFNISTPLLLEPDLDSDSGGQVPQELLEMFEELVEQARLFVAGRREQGELFNEDDDAPEREQQRIVDTAADRQREIDRIIAYLVGERPQEFGEWDDHAILTDLLSCFSERLDGKDFAQFSHLNEAGTSRARCAIATIAGVPRLWFGIDGKIDPEQTAATLMGESLVAAVRRVWSAAPEQLPLMDGGSEQTPAETWSQEVKPMPDPSPAGEITTEIVARCLHALLVEGSELVDEWHRAHINGADDDELLVLVKSAVHEMNVESAKTFSIVEQIGEDDTAQFVTVDVRIAPFRITVGKGKTKRQMLDADDVLLVVRGMLDIPQSGAASTSDDSETQWDEHRDWLRDCPVSDTNFRNHLERADVDVIRQVLNEVRDLPNQKTRVAALERRVRQLEEEAVPV